LQRAQGQVGRLRKARPGDRHVRGPPAARVPTTHQFAADHFLLMVHALSP
jgi:hypothetical protein